MSPALEARRMPIRCAYAVIISLLFALALSSVAGATVGRAHWGIIAMPAPTYFKSGDEGDFVEVIAVNDGSAPTDGTTFIVTDSLPHGIVGTASFGEAGETFHNRFGQPMNCPSVDRCEGATGVQPGEMIKVRFLVSPGAEAVGGGSITVSGGGAEAVTAPSAVTISAAPVPFGATVRGDLTTEGAGGALAGSHPLAFTTLLAFNVASVRDNEECPMIFTARPGCAELNADAKDLEVTIPPGLVGNPTAVPTCSQADFQEAGNETCPSDTQVGILQIGFYGADNNDQYAAVYNIEPPPGQPAELGFTVGGAFHIPMFFHVRTGGDYALQAQLSGITGADPVHFAALSIWGVPAAASHDNEREGQETAPNGCSYQGCVSHAEEKPFLTLPTNCSGSKMTVSVAGDSWQEPELPGSLPLLAEARLPPVTGCDTLAFGPSIAVAPDTLLAGAPASYDVKIHVPQNEDPRGRATPDVRGVQLTLPQGTVISPSSANGLAACTEEQFRLHENTVGHCPSQANIGQVEISTPLLDAPLRGSIFLGAPECRPCSPADAEAGKMAPLLIEARGPGVVIKLSGHTSIDQTTGQLTTTFAENPQLPFSNVEVTLKGGDGAPLVNPTSCGDALAVAKLTPWSSMTAVEPTAPPIPIGGCASSGFSPSLSAGTVTTARAGAFSAFSVTLSRPEGQQTLDSVTVDTPPGLLGMLSKVSLCEEAQAQAGTCPAAAAIGVASTTVGPGLRPLTIAGGKVFLTGPYEGRPFGLSIVVPTEAGPFQLVGNTGGPIEVVRASIAVDPHTAALTVASDPLPTRLEGVPLDIRSINVNINKPEFMFNPTDCDSMAIGGTATSTSSTVSAMSFPFQVAGCAALAFSPKFSVTTQAKTSKAGGASLHVKVTAVAGQANIGAVKVDLPIQLPSRNSTLQKACLAGVFDANPANCPAASVVGVGEAITPVLKGPLRGPAYLVSHGGSALPDLEIVLQGEGITLILDGTTHIKKGITSSTFRSIPDAPINTFDLVLPEGPHSVLGTNLPASAHRSMCGQRLKMPTMITGQNGAILKQTTAVAVIGCPKSQTVKHSSRASSRPSILGSETRMPAGPR